MRSNTFGSVLALVGLAAAFLFGSVAAPLGPAHAAPQRVSRGPILVGGVNVAAGGTIVGQRFRYEAHTAGDTLVEQESGTLHSNDGASGTITLALPAVEDGLEFTFVVRAAQQLRLDPSGTETISLPSSGVPGAAGKYLVADAIGETVRLVAADGNWHVLGYTGTWTAEA